MPSLIFSAVSRWFTLGAAALVSSAPALAQPAPEQIIIVGHYGKVPDSVRSLSIGVSYGDLDLSKPADRDILRQRVSLTARFLCDKLGESDQRYRPAPLAAMQLPRMQCSALERSRRTSHREARLGFVLRLGCPLPAGLDDKISLISASGLQQFRKYVSQPSKTEVARRSSKMTRL